MTDYHDGLYENARRNYTPSRRSWHIPAESEFKRPTFLLVICALVVCVSLLGVWVS